MVTEDEIQIMVVQEPRGKRYKCDFGSLVHQRVFMRVSTTLSNPTLYTSVREKMTSPTLIQNPNRNLIITGLLLYNKRG